MSTRKISYPANNQAITITLASLANNGVRASTALDNTSNLDLDTMLVIKIKTGASAVSATGYVNVYVYGSADGGTSYSDGVTGSDAGYTPTAPPNQRRLFSLNAVANATTYESDPWSVAQAFGGQLPDHWGILIENKTGAALDSTEGNHAKFYERIQETVA